mmetsp:Transcript_2343/g.8847  ORF Transcript_2343/g.8847 Transcript_2343/m.8847 type:complete len:299 (-) Transcript_2343:494-1390(-)
MKRYRSGALFVPAHGSRRAVPRVREVRRDDGDLDAGLLERGAVPDEPHRVRRGVAPVAAGAGHDVDDGRRELFFGGGGFVLLGPALAAHAEHERVLDHREQPRRGDEGEGRGEEVRVPLKRRGCFGVGFGIFGIFGVVAPGELEQRAPARLGGFVPGGAGRRLVLVVALVAVAARAEQRRRGAPAQELELGDGRLDRRRRPRVRVGHVDVGEVRVEGQEVAHARVGARVRRHVRLAAVHDRPASSALHGGRRVVAGVVVVARPRRQQPRVQQGHGHDPSGGGGFRLVGRRASIDFHAR